jgi:prepilin-type processing-associated H-X9-DG protein
LVKSGYNDMRAYRYYGYAINPDWMDDTVEDYYFVGLAYQKDDIMGQCPGAACSASKPSPMMWNNKESQSYTMPSGRSITLMRLREGIERFFITDVNNPAGAAAAQSDTIIMADEARAYSAGGGGLDSSNRYNHVPGGVNALYMDGHVEFMRFRTPGGRTWMVNQFAYKMPTGGSWGSMDFP